MPEDIGLRDSDQSKECAGQLVCEKVEDPPFERGSVSVAGHVQQWVFVVNVGYIIHWSYDHEKYEIKVVAQQYLPTDVGWSAFFQKPDCHEQWTYHDQYNKCNYDYLTNPLVHGAARVLLEIQSLDIQKSDDEEKYDTYGHIVLISEIAWHKRIRQGQIQIHKNQSLK